MTSARRKFARANSGTSQHRRLLCPDSQVCPQCPDNENCIYLQNKRRRDKFDSLLEILEHRVSIANTCLVNVRNLSRILGRKIKGEPGKCIKFIDETLTAIKAERWGNACTDLRLEKWNVRPRGSKIYKIDHATLESFRWYANQVRSELGLQLSTENSGGERN